MTVTLFLLSFIPLDQVRSADQSQSVELAVDVDLLHAESETLLVQLGWPISSVFLDFPVEVIALPHVLVVFVSVNLFGAAVVDVLRGLLVDVGLRMRGGFLGLTCLLLFT
jgi:hypothetical protein